MNLSLSNIFEFISQYSYQYNVAGHDIKVSLCNDAMPPPARETELKQLRKSNADYEEHNALLSKTIDKIQ